MDYVAFSIFGLTSIKLISLPKPLKSFKIYFNPSYILYMNSRFYVINYNTEPNLNYFIVRHGISIFKSINILLWYMIKCEQHVTVE